MKIDIAGVINCEGAELDFTKEYDAGSFEFSGSEYFFDKPISVEGRVSNIGSALKIKIALKGEYRTVCDRCGCDIVKSVFSETEENITDRCADFDEEMFNLNGHILDITGAVLTLLFSGLPIINLCREDCRGLCPKCGTDLNVSECNCDTTRYDPRFAIFRKLSGNGEV